MALTINFNGLTDLQWQAIFEFLNRYLVPNIVKEPGSPRGQIFNAYLEQINLVATGQLGIEDFLFNIGDIFPVAGEDNDRFRELAEQTQYNGFLKEFEEILASEDPASAIQGLFDRYENVGIADNSIILGELDSFGGINSFSLMNPQNVLDRVLIGDNDWGVTVQMCTTTVTTNCVDPKNIKDIWEDFGRHVQVIFKGLEIPGLPEWLPLPGIMRLPTIGEIWDRISGPFNDAAREQMRDCMSKDDDGDGVANTASYCIENRDIAGIITQGILDGTGELVDATTEAVKGIVDKALETLDCVTDPAACATKVKDTIEGIFKSADPTQPGLPDWMRVIIIGSQYGDKVLKELEKIFGSDIDGDGTIGITQEQFDCSTINRNGGVVEKEEDCGACLPNFVEVDGQCTNWTDTGVTAEECAAKNREHIPSTGAGTNSACGGCLPDFQVNETGDCVASPIKCEGNQVLNETTGRCEDPPPDCTPGGPCTDETGASGTYDENCDCVADWINSGPSKQDCSALGKTHVPADDATQTPSSCGSCEQEGWTDTGQSGECVAPPTTQVDCTQPRPSGTVTFDLINAQDRWDAQCGETHCTDGSTIDSHVNGDCQLGLTSDCQEITEANAAQCGKEKCPDGTFADIGACSETPPEETCPNGDSPALHTDNDCNQPCRRGLYDFGEGCVSLTEVCTNPQTDEEYRVCGQHEQCGEDTDNPGKWVKDLSECNTPDDPGNEGDECTDALGNKGILVANEKGDLECIADSGTPTPQVGDDCPLGDNPTGGVLQENPVTGELVCVPKGTPPGLCEDGSIPDPEKGCREDWCDDAMTVPKNEDGSCPDVLDCSEITDANAVQCGKEKCPDGTFADIGTCPEVTECTGGQKDYGNGCEDPCEFNNGIPASSLECIDPEGSCANGAVDYPTCTQCEDGSIPDAIDGCAGPTINCADYNQQTNEDGTCGPCLPGYVKDTSQPDEPCVAAPEDPCPAGFALNSATGLCEPVTCPDGESFCEATGQCETAENCPDGGDDGGTTGGGGFGGGGGGGMFDIKPITISGDPQLLSRTEFPITDFLAGLFTGSGGGRA